ncbi:MAG: response regulator [Treponema sp.]|jgi:signal transduction histidine kinase/DNA-binding response OmpR family regulator|nr:response regulator [Treponema sp.]
MDSRINLQINERMKENLVAARLEIQRELAKNAGIAKSLAAYAESGNTWSVNPEEMKNFLQYLVSSNPNTVGCGILYEPYQLHKDKYYAGPYVHRETGRPVYEESYGNIVDYFSTSWYINGKKSKGEIVWSGIYYDPVPHATLITAAVPFFDQSGNIRGVSVSDMSLADIRHIARSISVGDTGKAFILGVNGEYISYLDDSRTISDTIMRDKDHNLVTLGTKILSAEDEGMASIKINDTARRVFFSTIPETRWTLVVLINEKEITHSTLGLVLILGIVPLAGLILAVLSIVFTAERLRQIAKGVNDFADLIASGNFTERIEITESDEFGTMEKHLNKMAEEMDAMHRDMQETLHTAQIASRAKSDFLANMSHEIRTPMNAIIGMTAIAKKTAETAKKDHCLKKIEDASTHLLGIINDILDMSKIEANKLELTPEEFDFEKMLQKVVNVIGFRVDEKEQDLLVHIDPGIPRFLIGDDQRLSQVLTNLLSNAVKFTPDHGSIRLESRLKKKEGRRCIIEFKVSDSGIGISEEQQARLFYSFSQGDSSISRKFGGTGLGLVISRRIIEMMNGRIRIDSDPGKGATFFFTIEAEEGEAKGLTPSNPGWKALRVLAVDDDPNIRNYFTEIADQAGFFCDTAAAGGEAMDLIGEKGPYDVYFVDWKMPGMNGIELSALIKENTKEKKAVIIMMSAVDWNSVEKDARNAGIDKFLSKPIFPSVIADCLSECLGMRQINPETAEPAAADNFEGRRILLVEDVEINQEVVTALLEPVRLAFDCARNGIEAVQIFGAAPDRYDLIFMDVHMPEMDGYEATHRIRALEKPGKRVPIVAMTANVFREDIEKCLEAGMDAHVGKPIDMEEVLSVLRKFLPQHTA